MNVWTFLSHDKSYCCIYSFIVSLPVIVNTTERSFTSNSSVCIKLLF